MSFFDIFNSDKQKSLLYGFIDDICQKFTGSIVPAVKEMGITLIDHALSGLKDVIKEASAEAVADVKVSLGELSGTVQSLVDRVDGAEFTAKLQLPPKKD